MNIFVVGIIATNSIHAAADGRACMYSENAVRFQECILQQLGVNYHEYMTGYNVGWVVLGH